MKDKDKETESEMEYDVKTLSTSLINELKNLTPEQTQQLLDALENGIVNRSPSRIETNYLEKSNFFPKRK